MRSGVRDDFMGPSVLRAPPGTHTRMRTTAETHLALAISRRRFICRSFAGTDPSLYDDARLSTRQRSAVLDCPRAPDSLDDCDITTIALHTDAERRAMFVRQADESVVLRKTEGIVYLDHAELERALLKSKADAVWVGWGFVAEDIAFAELCARLK